MTIGYYQNELRDLRGNALTAAVVAVFNVGTTNPATLFSDAAGTVPLVSSPLATAPGLVRPGKDSAGNIAFFADDSVEYDVRVTNGSQVFTLRARPSAGSVVAGTYASTPSGVAATALVESAVDQLKAGYVSFGPRAQALIDDNTSQNEVTPLMTWAAGLVAGNTTTDPDILRVYPVGSANPSFRIDTRGHMHISRVLSATGDTNSIGNCPYPDFMIGIRSDEIAEAPLLYLAPRAVGAETAEQLLVAGVDSATTTIPNTTFGVTASGRMGLGVDIGAATTRITLNNVGNPTWTGIKISADAASTGDLINCRRVIHEVQTVTITGTPTGGTFTLTFEGQTTGPIAYNANAFAVYWALITGLTNIGPSDIRVSGGPGPGTPYVVSFLAQLGASNRTQMTATGSFTGGTAPAIAVTTTTDGSTDTGTGLFRVLNSGTIISGNGGGVQSWGGPIALYNTTGAAVWCSITSAGPRWNDATLEQTTVGAAGAAAVLPGAPAKWLKVRDSANVAHVIPAWLAA